MCTFFFFAQFCPRVHALYIGENRVPPSLDEMYRKYEQLILLYMAQVECRRSSFLYIVLYMFIIIHRRNVRGTKIRRPKRAPTLRLAARPLEGIPMCILYIIYYYVSHRTYIRKRIEQIDKSRIFAETRTLIRSLKPLSLVGIACVFVL